jgi:acyl-CoA-binding protein
VRHLTRLFSPQSLEPSVAVACEPLSVTQFQAKSEAAHWDKELKWRLIQRPGGAFIKPDDWYRLYAASMQAKQGDNTSERPMWADHGGIDFHGRASWDAWAELKGMDTEQATAKFCRVYAEAHTPERFSSNFHGK